MLELIDELVNADSCTDPERILSLLESAGMLPPEYYDETVDPNLGFIYRGNKWEPEDDT